MDASLLLPSKSKKQYYMNMATASLLLCSFIIFYILIYMIKNAHSEQLPNKEPVKHKENRAECNAGFFHNFAKLASKIVGQGPVFFIALLFIIIWSASGPFFHYSDTWQLIVNTVTSVTTFLIVFIIQNTQHRETQSIQLKLDELIRSHKPARNSLINLDKLSDKQIEELERKYKELSEHDQ